MGHRDEIVLADAYFPRHSINLNVLRADGLRIAPLLDAILPLFEFDLYVKAPIAMMDPVPGGTIDFSVETSYKDQVAKHVKPIPNIECIERFAF